MSSIKTVQAPAVSTIAGCTYRQLDYWVRSGIIKPSGPATGSGSRRLFSIRNIITAARLAAVSSAFSGGSTSGATIPVSVMAELISDTGMTIKHNGVTLDIRVDYSELDSDTYDRWAAYHSKRLLAEHRRQQKD